MSKYYGVDGKKVGKIGGEKYYIDKGENIVQKSNKYYPVNSTLLKREKFKEYVLSLFDIGIPQIYVLDELPEDLYPYALLFVKDEQENYKVYVDKEEKRIEIKLGGEDNYDAVNVVENLPEDLNNNVIYYSENKIEEEAKLKKDLKLDEQKSYIYVYEDETIKQVIPNVDYIAEEQMVFKNKNIDGKDNTITNLIPENSIKPGYIINKIEENKKYYGFISFEEPKEIVFFDVDGEYVSSYVYRVNLVDNIITAITNVSANKVYYDGVSFMYEGKEYERYEAVDQFYPILDKSIAYSTAIKTYTDTKCEPINQLTTKSLKNIYNTTLTTDRLMYTDSNGCLAVSDITKTNAKSVIDNVRNKCLGVIYTATLNKNKVLMSNSQGNVYTSDIDVTTANDVISNIPNKSLKYGYNNTFSANQTVITDNDGCLIAGRISAADMDDVVSGVKAGSVKNIYDRTLTADRLTYSDNNGCLTTSDVTHTNAKSVIDGVKNKFLSATYNTNLTANKMLGSNGSGKLYATGIDTTTANNVINGISTKSFKNVYNTTITANKILCTDGSGIVTTTNKYTVASPLEMYSNKIELGQVFDTSGGLGYWKIGIDVYGRVSARQAIDVVQILGYIKTDRGSITVNTPSNNCALFFLNTHGGNFYLAQICINTNSGYRRVFEVLKTSSSYGLPQVTRNSDTNVTITATGNCRAVIFTFNTGVT